MSFEMRPSEARDAHYLIDIDTKCFFYAWTPEEWRQVSQECLATVVTFNGEPIAMAVFGKNPDGDVEIVKVAVKQAFRLRGVSRRLIYNCALYAREIGAAALVMLIPEYRLRPGDPDDLSVWLGKLGFRATTIFRKEFHAYGRDEDGVQFSIPIPLS